MDAAAEMMAVAIAVHQLVEQDDDCIAEGGGGGKNADTFSASRILRRFFDAM